ncbi:MAG: cystathionine beta-lyase, partial [Clostridium sp.]
FGGNAFAAAALIGAYDKSELWLDELMEYIEGNADYFVNYINNEIPRLKVHKPEGTYLMWVDCEDLNMSPEELNEFMLNKCNVILNKGITFGESGKYFVRFNLGCNRQQIKDVLKVIKEQIELL